jgi:hypothetical protein
MIERDNRKHSSRAISIAKLIGRASLPLLMLSYTIVASASSGPSVKQLQESLDEAWDTLLEVTNCDRKPPQDAVCMEEHNGKTLVTKLFGQPVNSLILFEETSRPNVLGPVFTQQTGFLIGPFDGYAYKVVNEQQASGTYNDRSITDNGLKVFAHAVSGKSIDHQGVELNKGMNWLDGVYEPWTYHWSALPKVRQSLEDVTRYLKLNYRN